MMNVDSLTQEELQYAFSIKDSLWFDYYDIRIVGSYAFGIANELSDIDIIILVDDARTIDTNRFIALIHKMSPDHKFHWRLAWAKRETLFAQVFPYFSLTEMQWHNKPSQPLFLRVLPVPNQCEFRITAAKEHHLRGNKNDHLSHRDKRFGSNNG